jgi:hypothetical protein
MVKSWLMHSPALGSVGSSVGPTSAQVGGFSGP